MNAGHATLDYATPELARPIRFEWLSRCFDLFALSGVLVLCVLIFWPSSRGAHINTKTGAARAELYEIAAGLELLKADIGWYPSDEEGFNMLANRPVNEPRWNGPYARMPLVDPWGRQYGYKHLLGKDSENYLVFSLGPKLSPMPYNSELCITGEPAPVPCK